MMQMQADLVLFHAYYGTQHFITMAAIQTVFDAMVICGFDHEALFMEESQAQCLADSILDYLFTLCMDITFKEFDDHFKTYLDLIVAQGQIRLRPGMQKNM